MFVTPAYAQDAGAAGGLISIVPFILIFVIMYFFADPSAAKRRSRNTPPWSKRCAVVTKWLRKAASWGKISKVKEDGEVEVEIAEGVRVRVLKQDHRDGFCSKTRTGGKGIIAAASCATPRACLDTCKSLTGKPDICCIFRCGNASSSGAPARWRC